MIILVLFALLISPNAFAKAESPLKFSEEVEFLGTSENVMIDFNKTDDFIGVLSRVDLASSAQKTLDLYYFKSAKMDRINKDGCQELADKVFGPSSEIELKTISKELFKSPRNGEICEIILKDEDKEEMFKERRFFAFISKEKVYGIVSRFNNPAKKDQAEELRKFIKGLR